ncbi:hypothetical protein D3C71_2228930 [compost metagenome]
MRIDQCREQALDLFRHSCPPGVEGREKMPAKNRDRDDLVEFIVLEYRRIDELRQYE